MKKTIITKEQIEQVKSFINEQLRLRCINVKTKLEQVDDRLELSSTKFNTVPVLHSEIEIGDFGSSISNQDEKICYIDEETQKVVEKTLNRTRIFIRIHASYEGNGVGLFTVYGMINKGKIDDLFLSTERIR